MKQTRLREVCLRLLFITLFLSVLHVFLPPFHLMQQSLYSITGPSTHTSTFLSIFKVWVNACTLVAIFKYVICDLFCPAVSQAAHFSLSIPFY